MVRALALLIIGIALVVGIVFAFSKASDALRGQGGTIGKALIVIAIAAGAFWLFGEGLVFRYLND